MPPAGIVAPIAPPHLASARTAPGRHHYHHHLHLLWRPSPIAERCLMLMTDTQSRNFKFIDSVGWGEGDTPPHTPHPWALGCLDPRTFRARQSATPHWFFDKSNTGRHVKLLWFKHTHTPQNLPSAYPITVLRHSFTLWAAR